MADLIEPISAEPTSGFFTMRRETGAPAARRAHPSTYADALVRTSDVLLKLDHVRATLPALLAAIDETTPMRALVLVEPRRHGPSGTTARSAGNLSRREQRRLEARGRGTFAYFSPKDGAVSTLADEDARGEIILPLVDDAGAIIAVLLFASAEQLGEPDVEFADALATQFGAALARHYALEKARTAADRAAAQVRANELIVDRERVARITATAELRRASFLLEAVAILDPTAEASVALSRVARLAVHRIADGCVFEVGGREHFDRTSATPWSEELIEHTVARLAPRALLLRHGLVAGRERRRLTDAELQWWRDDGEAAAIVRDEGLEWLVCAPLWGRADESAGVLVLFSSHRDGHPMDLRVIEQLARYVAASLDRGRSYRSALGAVERRDVVLATVAHDLKTPLNVILLTTTALLGRAPPGADRRDVELSDLEGIRQSIVRMNRLVDDLVDVSSIDLRHLRLERSRQPLDAIVRDAREVVAMAANAARVSLQVDLPAVLPDVWCDHGRILQVLVNLVSNAVKFTPPGGSVTIGARVLETAVMILVRDTGAGIAQGDLPFIFDRFWQARATASLGNGLGLTIARGIVEDHGGRMTVDSVLGRGTTFTFTLPIAGSRH